MKITPIMERERLQAVRSYLELYHQPEDDECGPGSDEFVQTRVATEICIDNIKSFVTSTYSVLQDPDLYPRAMDALNALIVLNMEIGKKARG